MKCYAVGGVGKASQQAREVAVANENLRMSGDLPQIERVQQIIRSVAAAGANNCAYIFAYEHLLQFPSPAFHGARKIQIALDNRVEIERLVSQSAQRLAASLQQFLFDVRRGSDYPNFVS